MDRMVAEERWQQPPRKGGKDPRLHPAHGYADEGPTRYGYSDDQWDDELDHDFAGPPYRGEPGPVGPPYRGPGPGRPLHSPHNGYSSDQASTVTTADPVGPSYLLEHLATFRVAEDSELQYPADGMRRLLHMEKTSGIWTQKMQLRLERDWVLILSHENEDVVERFPIELITEPTAFTSDDPKELYNNIFIFVVAEDPKENFTTSTEMHIFQCLRISAKDLVEDMKLCMTGKWGALVGANAPRRTARGHSIPPPPQERPPEPPMMHNGYRDNYINMDAPMRGSGSSSHHHAHHHRGTRSDRSSVDGAPGAPGGAGGGDDASSVGSESYAKDVAILNCCFDDIERFIARLQHTAAATQELEKRRRSRKNKKKEVGDGLLSMRAKPPPEIEFVEILQKFKLSFNMLGKLRTYIHEPNAPELVHFIFTPLALIVDASRDSNYGTNLPAKVVSPLLTQEAVDLLTNCLSSRETELWQSLDDAWIIPREHWKFPVPPYRPVFSSGWAPELSDEPRDPRAELKGRSREEYEDYYQSKHHGASPPPDRYPRHHPYSESEVSGSESASGPEGPGAAAGPPQHQWLAELRRRGCRIVQVTYPRTANNDKELTVVRGEYLEVLDDSRKWWRCGNSRGQKAHVPHTIVTPFTPAMLTEGGGYHGASSSDDDSSPPPRHYKAPKPPTTPIPKPPPPPPPDFTPGNTIVERPPRKMPVNSQQIFGSTRETSDLVNRELKGVLEEFRKRKPHIEVQKTPDVYVDNRATPAEVQEWMEKKNFSERVRKQFDGVDGEKLFSLSKDQLKSFCGETDGNRLFSQITIQRNVSGYKTVNTSELKRILQEQRKRVDIDAVDNVSQNFSFLKDYNKSEVESAEDSDKEEAPVVRKPKKSKDPNKKKSSSASSAKSASKSPSSSSTTPTPQLPNNPPRPVASYSKPSTSKPSPGAKPKAGSSGGKKKPETGTLKEQIKKQRRKIIYKTDDDDDEAGR